MKKLKIFTFFTSLGFFAFLYILATFVKDHCAEVYGLCWNTTEFFQALFFVLLPTLPISAAMFFINDYIFKAWVKFTTVFILFSVVVILISSPHTGGFIFPSDRQMAELFLIILYSAISAIVIARAWWRGRAV